MSTHNQYDTIIIGAGIGGLTAGNFLAKSGHKVLILEKHFKIGGYVSSYRHKGYLFDVPHVIGGLKEGAPLDRIFRYLNLYGKVQFNSIEKIFLYKLAGYSISCYVDIEKFKNELKKNFPKETKNINRITEEMALIWKEIISTYYDPSWFRMLFFPAIFPRLVKYQNWTFERFLSQFTNDYKLKKVMGAGWGYLGLNITRVSALYMVGMLMSYHTGGAWYPKGGFQSLSDAFAVNFNRYGGIIKTGVEVDKIIFQNKKAVGVRTKKREEFFADQIISNADTKKTFLNLCEKKDLPKKLSRRVKDYVQSVSGVVVHLVVDMYLSEELSCGGIMYFPNFDTDEHQFSLYDQGKMDQKSFGFGMSIATLKDSDLVPSGKHVLDLVYMPAPYEYFKKTTRDEYAILKEHISEKMIQVAQNVIPDLGKHILFKEISTPLTYERYTGATEGGWYDIDCSPKQALLGRIRNKTPMKGLYLTGAKTFPGEGMFGAMHAGLFTADSILRGQLTRGGCLLKDELRQSKS